MTGCGGSSANGTTSLPAPTGLAYSQSSVTAIVGQVIAADTPSVTGAVTSYTVSPALPAGLSLSASSGVISGTPTGAVAQGSYTVTATNSAGSTTAAVQITVNPAAPTNLVYSQGSITATVGKPILVDTPTVAGVVSSYSVSPALPAGLSLNTSLGAISGVPTAAAAAASYTVTAANVSGSTTAVVQIGVNPAAPTNLAYSQTAITAAVGQAIAVDTPTVAGTVSSYSVIPALPAGLSLNTATGVISGTPTAVVAQSDYLVAAINVSGNATEVLQITVNPAAPTNLVYPVSTMTVPAGGTIATDIPSVTGTVTGYSVSPALPAGLSLDPSTGAISGTATTVSAQATYTIAASNSAGSTTANVTIAVSSFSEFGLLDLGHTQEITVLRLQSTRLFSQDSSGHWVLWDYAGGTQVASGDPLVQSSGTAYPSDMAGGVIAIGTANAVEIRSSADGSLITTLSSPSLDPASGTAWWKLATDGSYVVSGYASGLFVWSTADGHLVFSKTGNYAQANAFAAPSQVQVALGPAGNNVIETDSVPSGASSIGAAFTATFNTWFSDGSHFITNTGQLSPFGTPSLYDLYIYSAGSVQQGMAGVGLLGTPGGYGNWFWTAPSAAGTLDLYAIGATTPVASYNVSSIPLVQPSGSTLALAPYGTGSATLVDLSGSAPVQTTYSLPIAYLNALAAASPTQWVAGNRHGVILDGASASTTPRFFGYGDALSIAGAAGEAAIATASGRILTYNPASQTLISTINFTSSKLFLSSDGTVLAAQANETDNQYELDRTLNIYSLPAGSVTYTFAYSDAQVLGGSTLDDYTMSASGNALGLFVGTWNGTSFVDKRQVTPLSGSPILWSDSPGYGNFATPFLSPDGTLVAVSTGDYSPNSTTSIYKNGLLAATVNGMVVGWIDNNRVLVDTFTVLPRSSVATYAGAVIYDATGARLTTLNALPQMTASQVGGSFSPSGFTTVNSDAIYSPATYSIYSLTTGAVIWSETLPHSSNYSPYVEPSAISGDYLVFVSGHRVVVDYP